MPLESNAAAARLPHDSLGGKAPIEGSHGKALDTSSSGDDRISKAFGIDRTLTLTPRVSSLEEGGPPPAPMTGFPVRALRFMCEEEEEKQETFKLSSDFRSKILQMCRQSDARPKSPDRSTYSTTDSKYPLDTGGQEAFFLGELDQLRLSSKSGSLASCPSPDNHSSRLLPFMRSPHAVRIPTSYSFQPPDDSHADDINPLFVRTAPTFPQQKPKTRNANHKNCKVNALDYVIDPSRIESMNLTTLYVANIPNKYTKKMLMKFVDEKFAGRYDFFYLPIDFENKCNVGYAFVNFVDLAAVRSFFYAFNGRKWPRFNSSKICEIRYAKIQGRESCMKHFANSCLMKQEDEGVRPFVRLPKTK